MFTCETISLSLSLSLSLSPHLKLPHLVVLHGPLKQQASYHKLCAKKMNCMPLTKCLKSYHVRCTPEPLNRANENAYVYLDIVRT